ncbi:MAG TPA: hypothetical protein VIX37_08545 [Candidatus Sulfotelmatobacter sp.]
MNHKRIMLLILALLFAARGENSTGGYLAFDSAMFESQYFVAVAVHANRIAEDYVDIVQRA